MRQDLSSLALDFLAPGHPQVSNAVLPLYCAAFPAEERVPFPVLCKKSQGGSAAFWGLSLCSRFCGFAYCYDTGPAVFLMYLAILPKLRGKGLGGQALELLARRYPGRTFTLDIELYDPAAPITDLRTRRRNFYLRSGYPSSGVGYSWEQVRYELLLSGGTLTLAEWQQVFRPAFGAKKQIELIPLAELLNNQREAGAE